MAGERGGEQEEDDQLAPCTFPYRERNRNCAIADSTHGTK